MGILSWIFGTNKKQIKDVDNHKKNINRLQTSYQSYHNDYERLKRIESKSNIAEDIVIGMAIDSVFDALSSNNDLTSSSNSYDSDSSSGFSGGFGGGDYSGGGSSGDWSSGSDSSSYDSGSSDSYSSND